MKIGDKFKGKINGAVFKVVDKYTENDRYYYAVEDIKTGKVYHHSIEFIEHLQIEIL